ncbi:hypothetical protein JCM16358_11510 [Halanaerocella petrolearia]
MYGFAPPEIAIEEYYRDLEEERKYYEKLIDKALEENDKEMLKRLGYTDNSKEIVDGKR